MLFIFPQNRIRILFLLAACFLSPNIFSQKQFLFEKISSEDGLSNNTVISITQDKTGRIWLGTYNGLNVFDGNQITSYRHQINDPLNSIADNRIDRLLTDKTGTLWIQQPNGWISRLVDPVKGIFRNYQLKLPGNEMGSLLMTDDGAIYIKFFKGRYVYHYNTDSFVFDNSAIHSMNEPTMVSYFRLKHPEMSVQQYCVKGENEVFIATLRHGIIHLTETFKHNYLEESIVHQPDQPFSLSNNEVYSVFIDRFGILWAGTKDGGVNKWLMQASFVKTLSHDQGAVNTLPSGSVRAISQDKNGDIWTGMYSEGIAIFSPKSGKYSYINHQLLPHQEDWDRIRCLFRSSDNCMWVGSYGGLCRIDTETGKKQYFLAGKGANELISGRIYSIVEDDNGYLWIGTWAGIDRLKLSTGAIEHILSQRLTDVHIRNLMFDRNGRLWIGTEFGGIHIFDPRTAELTVMKNIPKVVNSLSNNSVFSIFQASSGEVWIGTCDGLNVYNLQNKYFKHIAMEDGLPSNLILGVIEDKSGNIWVSTSKGVVRLDKTDHLMRSFDREDGWINTELNEGAYYINSSGEMFFGGNNGVTFFYPDKIVKHPIPPEIAAEIYSGRSTQLMDCHSAANAMLLSYFDHEVKVKMNAFHYLNSKKNLIAWRLLPSNAKWSFKKGAFAEVSLNTLRPGSYKFEYMAANPDGIWGEVKTISFKVDTPFWLKTWFWLIVSLVILLLLIWFIRFKLYHEQQRRKLLEIQVQDRTSQLEVQHAQLEMKNKELEVINLNVIQQKDHILAQHEALLELHAKLHEVNESKMKFYTNVSHEIRTPLTLISGPLEQILNDKSLQEHHVEKLQVVHKQTNYLLGLVNQLLDYRKLESGNLMLDLQPGELVLFCKEIIRTLNFEAQSRNISLTFECDFSEIHVFFDPQRLRQILINLLSNALKFTCNFGWIKVLLKQDSRQNTLVFEISDNGIGIPVDRQTLIFERFYQVGKAMNPSVPGTGIGLSLARDLAKLHHGDIQVYSEEGRGSSFTLTLPCQLVSESITSQPVKNMSIGGIEASFSEIITVSDIPSKDSRPTVMVVDDHEDMAHFIAGILEPKYNVETANNGKEALKILKFKNVNVILSDWLMPELDGLSFCEKLKQNKKFRHIPFIMITALSELSDKIKAMECGADDFISKPFSNQLLLTKIENLIVRDFAIIASKELITRLEPENVKEMTEDVRMVSKLVKVIEAQLGNSGFNSDALGMTLGLSKMQTYRKIKQSTGLAPNELIQSLRLKRGKQLLEEPGFTISEVAYKVGFNDPKYFSRSFFKAFGVHPSEYQLAKMKEKG